MTRMGTNSKDNIIQSHFGVKSKVSTYLEKSGVNVKTGEHLTDDEIREINKLPIPDDAMDVGGEWQQGYYTLSGLDTKVWIDGEPTPAVQSISFVEYWGDRAMPNTPVQGTLVLCLFHDLKTRVLLQKLKYDRGFDIKVQSCDGFGNLYCQEIQNVNVFRRRFGVSIDDLITESHFDFNAENITDIKLQGPQIEKDIEERNKQDKRFDELKKEAKEASKYDPAVGKMAGGSDNSGADSRSKDNCSPKSST